MTTVELPGLNHLFQHCDTGSPLNYGALTETYAEHMLELMTDWIGDRAKGDNSLNDHAFRPVSQDRSRRLHFCPVA